MLSHHSAEILEVALRLYKHVITVAMQLSRCTALSCVEGGVGFEARGGVVTWVCRDGWIDIWLLIMGLFTVATQLVLLSITDLCSSCLQAVLSDHSAEVVGVALHPTNKYFITASADKSWAFYDLESTLCMAQVCCNAV